MKFTTPLAWFEIVTQDLERAITFYQSAFNIEFSRLDDDERTFAIFPYDQEKGQVGGALVHGKCYAKHKPCLGTIFVYLNTESVTNQLQIINNLGGKTVFTPTSIGECGYIAGFEDSEGNQIGLWSANP